MPDFRTASALSSVRQMQHVEYLARGFHQHIGRMSRTPALLADPQVMQGSERCVYFYKDASVDQKPSG